jgi:hypothetical protein
MRLEIPLERCLCIHSLSQVVDITIQLLLYQRQFIPEPANFILQSDSERSQIFKDVYEKVIELMCIIVYKEYLHPDNECTS